MLEKHGYVFVHSLVIPLNKSITMFILNLHIEAPLISEGKHGAKYHKLLKKQLMLLLKYMLFDRLLLNKLLVIQI